MKLQIPSTILLNHVFPLTAVFCEEVFGFGWAPGAGGVVWKVASGDGAPDVEDRSDNAPGGFDHIGTLEQGRVAYHAIVKQTLVAGRDLVAEIVIIIKVHVDRADVDEGARDLCPEMKSDAFVGLDVDDYAICPEAFDAGLTKQDERGFFEFDDDGRIFCRHTLAGTDIDGNVGPSPIVETELEGDKSLGVRVRSDLLLRAIFWNSFAADLAFSVLPADGKMENFLGRERLDRRQDLCLLVADSVRFERHGRLHGGQCQKLKNMVRD